MSRGYYRSLDLELAGERVLPTTADALDAYIVPLALERARAAGVPVPEHAIVTERFPAPPFLAYPINPFSSRVERIDTAESLDARRAGLTYTGKYAVLVQRLPEGATVATARCVFGRSDDPAFAAIARAALERFGLPLATARAILAPDGALLSAYEPLPWRALTREEIEGLEAWGAWRD